MRTEIQRYRGVSWSPRAHTGQVSAETRDQRPEAGRLWGTQTVSFSAIHALCLCPHSSPSSAHPSFYPCDTLGFSCVHITKVEASAAWLMPPRVLCSAQPAWTPAHLSSSLLWRGPGWGGRAAWSDLPRAVCPALSCVTAPGQVSEKGLSELSRHLWRSLVHWP